MGDGGAAAPPYLLMTAARSGRRGAASLPGWISKRRARS